MNIKYEITKIVMLAKDKYLAGEFEFIKADNYIAEIQIDDIIIELWIANDPLYNFDFYRLGGLFLHNSSIYAFDNDEERFAGYSIIKDELESAIKENLKLQIEELQSVLAVQSNN